MLGRWIELQKNLTFGGFLALANLTPGIDIISYQIHRALPSLLLNPAFLPGGDTVDIWYWVLPGLLKNRCFRTKLTSGNRLPCE